MPDALLHTNKDQLLPLIADGDEIAMRSFFTVYFPRLYYFGFKLIRNKAEAQDQAQEALASLWQKRENFRNSPLKEAEGFLFTVVRNRSYNYIKHQKMKAGKQDEISAGLSLSEDIIEMRLIQEDIFNRIFREIDQLPEAQVKLLKMIYVEGLETHEIAARLGITSNNVRIQKARTLEKLRTIMLRKGLLPLFFLFFH